jgi:hypothetical protein
MHGTRVRLAGGALAIAGSCLLAGCGGGAAHVIGPGAGTANGSASATTTSTPPTSPPATSPPASGATTTVPPSGSSLNPSITNQIDSDLNALNNSLSQADNDLANPNKGDQ